MSLKHTKQDLLLGKLCVSKEILTKDELKRFLQTQEEKDIPLGILLLDYGLIDKEALIKLVKEHQKRLDAIESRDKGEELVFSRLILKQNLISPQAFRNMLNWESEEGKKVFIGIELLQQKRIELLDFLRAYHQIFKEIFKCPGCQKKFWLVHLVPGKKLRCKHCKTIFSAPSLEQEIAAHEQGVESTQVAQKEIYGQYEVLEEVAQGGMGVIYRAQKKRTGQIVALKVLLEELRTSQEANERFAREVKTLSKLKHPRVVSIHDVGIDHHAPYFTMDFVDGYSLSNLIEKGPVDINQAIDIIIKVCEGLQYAHEMDIIHRDIKPSNILLNTDNEPLITDFGLAKCLDSITMVTKTGSTLGSPFYMAPEQARGRLGEVGPRSDLYSLGVVFYEMLTAQNPFKGESTVEIYQKILTVEPTSPRHINSKISRRLDHICLKCLKKDRFQRYKSAAFLAKDLQALQNEKEGGFFNGIKSIFKK